MNVHFLQVWFLVEKKYKSTIFLVTLREGLIRKKKKKCEFSHFGSGPPTPLKSVKLDIFFSHIN